MGLPVEAFDKSKHNYLQKCFYVINLLKDKDYDLWENFHAQYCNTKPEESWELFQVLVEEYRKMVAPAPKKAVRKTAKAVKATAKPTTAKRKKAA